MHSIRHIVQFLVLGGNSPRASFEPKADDIWRRSSVRAREDDNKREAEVSHLRTQNRTLKGQLKSLQEHVLLQVNAKELELNKLKMAINLSLIEEKDGSDETQERHDAVNELRPEGTGSSPKNKDIDKIINSFQASREGQRIPVSNWYYAFI